MTAEESEYNMTTWRLIRRVKKWQRPLPRRTNIHRYTILEFFTEAAPKRIYIWSFRVENIVPAIYVGSILTLMPLHGIQVPTAIILALLLRANVPITVGLQILSNPFTVLPIWVAAYQIVRTILSVVGINVDPLNHGEVHLLFENFIHGASGAKLDDLRIVFIETSLGAIIMVVFLGLIVSFAYRLVANCTTGSYTMLHHSIKERKFKMQSSCPKETQTSD